MFKKKKNLACQVVRNADEQWKAFSHSNAEEAETQPSKRTGAGSRGALRSSRIDRRVAQTQTPVAGRETLGICLLWLGWLGRAFLGDTTVRRP